MQAKNFNFFLINSNDSVYSRYGIKISINEKVWRDWERQIQKEITEGIRTNGYDTSEAAECGVISLNHLTSLFNNITKKESETNKK